MVYLGSATFIKFKNPMSSTTDIGWRSLAINSVNASVSSLALAVVDGNDLTADGLVKFLKVGWFSCPEELKTIHHTPPNTKSSSNF